MKYTIIIGIDISKDWFDAACLSVSNPKKISSKFFLNSQEGFEKLEKWIYSFKKNQKECLICFEQTGVYCLKLSKYLHSQGWNYRIENALQLHLSSGIKRMKSDRSDAILILKYIYLRRFDIELSAPCDEEIELLKIYLNHREKLEKVKTQFINTMNEHSGRYDDTLLEYVNLDSHKLLKIIEVKISQIEKKIRGVINKHPRLLKIYRLITTVPGIKFNCAVYMILYTKGFTTHLNYKKFACYCGIAPFEYTSGKSIYKKSGIHYLGNKKMKSLLRMPALGLSSKGESEFTRYYKRKVSEGKHPLSVMNVVKNKMIARVYAVIKRGTPYVDYDNKLR